VTSTATEARDPQFGLALVGAAVAVVIWGASGVLINKIDMGGLAIAVYRFWIYAIVLVLWMRTRGIRVTRELMRNTAAGGIALGLDVALFFSAVKETTIVNATVISALQPVLVGAVAWRFFGERVRSRDIFLAAMAIVATLVVVAAGTDQAEWNLFGDLLAVGSVIAWSGYFVFSKASRGVVTSSEYTLGTALWTCLITTPLAMAFGQDLSWPSATNWAWLIVLALSAGVFGHVVMNWSLVRIPLWLGSTLTLLIPVSAATLAWIFLDQALTVVQVVAMVAVIATLALLVSGQTMEQKAPVAEPL